MQTCHSPPRRDDPSSEPCKKLAKKRLRRNDAQEVDLKIVAEKDAHSLNPGRSERNQDKEEHRMQSGARG